MSLIIPANSAAASGGYDVANSCRFNPGDSPKMVKASSSSGNGYKGTFSLWVKRSKLGAQQMIGQQDTGHARVFFNGANQLRCYGNSAAENNAFDLASTALFRDVGAWYHIVFAWDNTQSTASNRNKVYVNGVQITDFATETYNPQNTQIGGGFFVDSLNLTISGKNEDYFDGYMTEIVGIENTTYAPTDFGEFDEDSGIWKPIDGLEDLTFGTNGFYLDFEDSANLGNDVNGGTDFTESNLAATDQSTDTCTNNFATMNPLDNFYYNGTFSEGNLKGINGSGREASATATIAISNGKWFWEVQPKTNVAPFIGIQQSPSAANTSSGASMSTNGYGYLKTGKVETSDGSGGSTVLAEYATYAADDIIGVAVDLDGNKIYFYKNGALQGSGVTITAVGSTTNGHYLIAFGALGGQDNFEINFGSPPYSESGGETDGNGYGNFAHAPPSGYFALCTKNLAEYG
jgi:hypothetical protein